MALNTIKSSRGGTDVKSVDERMLAANHHANLYRVGGPGRRELGLARQKDASLGIRGVASPLESF